MAVLDTSIHAFILDGQKDVDGRVSHFGRPGHDEKRSTCRQRRFPL
jgi:hypothetical protein